MQMTRDVAVWVFGSKVRVFMSGVSICGNMSEMRLWYIYPTSTLTVDENWEASSYINHLRD